MEETKPEEVSKVSWLKRVGILGFLFFLIKGLVWIGIAAWAWAGWSK